MVKTVTTKGGLCASLLAAVALVLALWATHDARAYSLLPYYRSSITNLQVCVSTSYPDNAAAWQDGLAYWNATATDFGYSSTCTGANMHLFDDYNDAVGWDGLTQYYFSSYPLLSNTHSYLNQYYMQNYDRTWGEDNSVASHEIGHAIVSLNDLGAYSYAVMNGYTAGAGSRWYYYGISYPVQDDIDGTNARY